MKGKVLLIGGTGAMGIYLQEFLSGMGYDVVVTSRSAGIRENRGVRYLNGNGLDDDFVRHTLASEEPDAVVDFMCYSTEAFRSRMDWLLAGAGHYLFLSSYRVFSDVGVIVESSPRLLDVSTDLEYLKTDEYALSKARQENLLRSSKLTNWTILRPGITYSKGRFQFGCLEANVILNRVLKGVPVIIPAKMLDKKTTMSWGHDVALLISRLIFNPKAMGEDFNIITGRALSWREIGQIYTATIGMKICETTLEAYCRVCSPYQVRYDRMFDRVADNSKVLSATGIQSSEFTDLEIALPKELAAALAKTPVSYDHMVTLNAKLDRICNTKMCLSGLTISERITYWLVRYCNKVGLRLANRGQRFIEWWHD